MKRKKPNSQNICNAGEYYIASVLSANGFTTTITLGRAEKYDILAIRPTDDKAIKIQVKTLYGKGPQWRMNEKDGVEKNRKISDGDIFYAFVRLNDMEKPEYWIVPSKIVTSYVKKSHIKWKKTPRRDGKEHGKTKVRSFRIESDKYSPPDWEKKM
jgi:hypothetical protein